jgi:hypothetical protein
MKTEKLPEIVNIDTANEEIQRLAKRLGQSAPEFVANIYDANEKIAELTAELAKKADVTVKSPAKAADVAAPKITDPAPPKRKAPAGVTGLQRAIFGNTIAQGGEVPSVEPNDDNVTGLQRCVAANLKLQNSKSKTK